MLHNEKAVFMEEDEGHYGNKSYDNFATDSLLSYAQVHQPMDHISVNTFHHTHRNIA